MVREARFLSDDPWWVDPDRFVDEGDDDAAEFEPPATPSKQQLRHGRTKPREQSARRNPRRRTRAPNQSGQE